MIYILKRWETIIIVINMEFGICRLIMEKKIVLLSFIAGEHKYKNGCLNGLFFLKPLPYNSKP